ncbi:MAG: hypothetical protein NTX56_02780 [Proteobacteria bacterium]|nr:hypothetical protein [Pseudomonadota bacterium]
MIRIKLLALWVICQAGNIVAAIWMFLAIFFGSPRAWRIAVGYDQLGNATFGGNEDETISSRCWRYREELRYSAWVKRINWLFDDPNHCQNSFEDEEAKRQFFNASPPKSGEGN